MKQGKGLIMIHWSTETMKDKPGEKFLEWMGGFCDLDWLVNHHWTANIKDFPKHPVCKSVKPFTLNDEWYYHMRFVDNKTGLKPILFDIPLNQLSKEKMAHAVASLRSVKPLPKEKYKQLAEPTNVPMEAVLLPLQMVITTKYGRVTASVKSDLMLF